MERSKPPANRLKLLGLLASAGLVTGIVFACFHFSGRQPSYQGKSMAEWFRQLPPMLAQPPPQDSIVVVEISGSSPSGGGPTVAGASLRAIRSIGTNGLPFLFHKLAQHESPIRNWVQTCAGKCGIRRALFPSVGRERSQAVTALTVLSPLPAPWVGQLRRLSTNRDTNVALAAQCLLVKKDDAPAKTLLGVFP